ncbi:MAG: hypothetical protein ABJN62_08315 [Halioglobus sp.]
MTDIFVIRNQHGHYWAKSKQWVSGDDPKVVLRAKHEDEAINTLVELSTKDIDLRGEAVATELDERGNPVIEPSQIPLPSLEEDSAEDESAEEESAPVVEPQPDASDEQSESPPNGAP